MTASVMSISDIKKDAKHVYVVNCTKTDISIPVKDEDGISRMVRILRASIPQDAAEIVSPGILKKNASFKRAVANGYVRLVSEAEAAATLADPASKVQLSAIRKKLSRIPRELMVDEEVTALEAVSGGATSAEIRAEVKDIAVDTEEAADDKFARLLAIHGEDNLSPDEVTWLLSRLPGNNGEYLEILEWLQSKS